MIEHHSRPFRLREFKVEVTYRCTLNCIHCSSDARPSNSTEMALKDCIRIIQEASGLGSKEVAFSGGEPLVWPYIDEAAAAARTARLSVTIYTSGNVHDFLSKARRLAKVGAERFVFSVFGGHAKSHEQITRVRGSFDQTKSAMADAKDAGLVTEIHFVPMSTNYRELEEVVALAKEYGVSQVSVLRLVLQGRGALLRGRLLSRLQNIQLRNSILNLRKAGHKIRTGSPYNFLMLSSTPACCAAIDRLIVGPDLRIYPCDAFKQVKAEELVGTAEKSRLDTHKLHLCWKESPFLEAVRDYLTTPFGPPCDSCALLEKCLSGCLAQKVIAFGDLTKRPDPSCLRSDFGA